MWTWWDGAVLVMESQSADVVGGRGELVIESKSMDVEGYWRVSYGVTVCGCGGMVES